MCATVVLTLRLPDLNFYVLGASVTICVCGRVQILSLTAHSAGADTNRALSDLRFMLNVTGRHAGTGSLSSAERTYITDAITKLETKKVWLYDI